MHERSPSNDQPTGGIVRAARPSSKYTTFSNEVLRDQRLSFRALGILVEILSRPDNWQTRAETLAAGRKEGREAVRTALAELEKAGYLQRRKVREKAGRIRTVSVVYDEPQAPPTEPAGDQPEEGVCAGQTGDGFLGVGFPVAGKPVAGFLGPLRSTEKNNLEERSVSEVEWSNSVGPAKDHQKDQQPTSRARLTAVEGPPESGGTRTFVDWRAEDRDLFQSIVGAEMASDGSAWTAGTFPADVWYEALHTQKPQPIDWPGRYLSHLVDNGGFDTWLLAKGLDVYQSAAA